MARRALRRAGKHRLVSRNKQPHKRTNLRRPQPVRTVLTRSQCQVSGSFFQKLPAEVFNMILDKLSVLEISVFCMVSKEVTRCIVNYISTIAWKNKMIVDSFHRSTCFEQRSIFGHYRELGLLFKRCTLLLPTKDRLKFTFSKFSQIPCFMLDQCSQECIGFSSYGVFLQTLIAGWDELECQRVFHFLCDLTNLLQKVEAVITRKPAVVWHQELQVRLFCRQVLLDPWSNQSECHFWLSLLLKPWPMVSQAHLLLILYGPLVPEGQGWRDLVERGLPQSALWDLSRAVLLLCSKLEVKDQASHSMLTILEELTVIPQPWHVENVARFLVLCGNSICCSVLSNKAVKGRHRDISRIIVYIVLVCEKDGYHMTWAVKLVQQICKVFSTAPEKFRFVQRLESMFSEVIKEIFEFYVEGNHFEDRETFQMLCILLDSSARFHTKFIHMLLK